MMQVNSERAMENAKRWGALNNFDWLKLIRLQQKADLEKAQGKTGSAE